MKISDRTEMMMSQAVSLAQNGRMKSVIHLTGNAMFLVNMDDTILIKFQAAEEFPDLSFFANDYESKDINNEGNQVVFITLSLIHI